MKIYTINIEYGMPTVEQANIRLDQGLREARSQKYPIAKVIHGYGSSGKGGAIKKGTLAQLALQQRQGRIKTFLAGENFSPFYQKTQGILSAYPALKKDNDYGRENYGITIVFIR